MAQSSEILELFTQWDRIMHKMTAIEESPFDFGTGDLLTRSEVHTLMAIGKKPGSNVTDLARFFDITKSAVSQMVNKLLQKNLVEKYHNKDNDKEICLRLSPRGRIAFLGHEQFHLKTHARIEQRLREMTDEEFRFLQEFFRIIEETADESLGSPR
ncbi:MAG: MarR family transcriptional regulator [Methanoregula sp.]|uniref:MarR family transcriptional regulator n=1 Tax=Methanoregula sp. TaxID=2052170 RepID=UPI003BAE4D51